MQNKKEKSITQRLRQSDIYDFPIKWEDFFVATYSIHCGETFEDVCKTYKRLVFQYSLRDALETMYKIPAETED